VRAFLYPYLYLLTLGESGESGEASHHSLASQSLESSFGRTSAHRRLTGDRPCVLPVRLLVIPLCWRRLERAASISNSIAKLHVEYTAPSPWH